ncbi:MAG TPA: addiction module antidote protein, HigA family [Anaerolineaceae bacterium]|nr:addiction module antidote protein, HigA family [Anaerolineaceae bacterium]
MIEKGMVTPVHPGEVIREEFLKPLGISQAKLALQMRVPQQRINEIVNGKRAITADTALRLAIVFEGTTPEFWMSLQTKYDIRMEKRKRGDQIAREAIPFEIHR